MSQVAEHGRDRGRRTRRTTGCGCATSPSRSAPFTAVDDLDLDVPQRLVLRAARPVGLRQDHHAADGRRARDADRRARSRSAGQDITYAKPYQRPVNTVFQSYALFPHLDIYENVAFGLRRRKVQGRRRSRSTRCSSWSSSTSQARKKPAQLSGGQQQRVALARALINQPEVLLLDEPLGALDLKLRRSMQIELKRIQTEVGLTFVHVTHDQEEAMTMADTVAVMNAGRHRADGRARPSSTRTRGRRSSPTSSASPT